MGQLMTAADISQYLDIPRSAAYDILHRADCPTISWGRNLYVRKDDLDEWLLQQRKTIKEE